jgi:transcriptional regulator with XRE-family HTH domain
MPSMATKRHVPDGIRSLGEAVRYLRTERRMTLRALAQKAGISAPFLSDIEHGRRQTNEYEALAKALDVAVDELRRFDGRVTELKEWLAENPQLVALLKDLRDSGHPIPLEALRMAAKQGRR